MLNTTACQHCRHSFAIWLDRCPHCARPGLFPNVKMAEDAEEQKALSRRYDRAVRDAKARGAEPAVRDFEAAAASSVAVIARSFEDTQRLAQGDDQGYATYYQLTQAGVRFVKGEKWDVLRRVADEALFGAYKQEIRFAALSLDGSGLRSYGECSLVLREDMIAHRASVFEENSVVFMDRHDVPMSEAHKLPRGYRASWQDRSRLCIAKLGDKINAGTLASEFPGLLLRQSSKPDKDEFVEVHVGGPMTVRTLEKVVVMGGRRKRRRALARALRAKLKRFGVTVES